MDYDANQALASHLSVKKLPTTIIFQDRKEKARHVGNVSSETIKKTLKKNKKTKKANYEVW
jgi:thioredoxin-like negative regulator of GroEL